MGARAEERRLGYREVIDAFRAVAEAINDEPERDELLHLVAKSVCELFEIKRCSVYLKDDASGLYRGQVAHTGIDEDQAIKRLTCGIEADRFTQEILETRRPVLVANAQDDPRPVRAAMRAWNVRTMLGVPMIARQSVIGLLFLDNAEVAHDFTSSEQGIAAAFADLAATSIMQAAAAAELRESVRTVARQNERLRVASVVEDRLTTLAIDGASFSTIASTIAQLTGKPVTVHDGSFRRIASGTPADTVPLPQILDDELRGTLAVQRALGGLRPTRPSVVGPMPTIGQHRRCLISPIVVRDEHWGYVVLGEHGARFSAIDAVVVRRAAMLIGLEFAAEHRSERVGDEDPRDVVVRRLLASGDADAAVLKRAELHNLRLEVPHVVCHLRTEPDTGALSVSEVQQRLGDNGPLRGWAIDGADLGVTAIIEVDQQLPPVKAIAEAKDALEVAMADFVPDGGGLAIAVSTLCRAAGDYSRGQREAEQVMRCISTFGWQSTGLAAVSSDDLGPGRLLLASIDRPEADRFVSDTLGGLLLDADPRASDLLMTVGVFFECSRSVRESARRLDVHENTIRYRLSRASELTGLDLMGSADDQLLGQIALLVLRVERRLPLPPESPAGNVHAAVQKIGEEVPVSAAA